MNAPKASERVTRAIEDAGWTPAALGAAAVSWCSFSFGQDRDGNPKPPHHLVDLVAGERFVQVSISPTGRSVRVFVDNEEVPPHG